MGEPPLEEASALPRRDSLSKLNDIIRSTSVDGHVSLTNALCIGVLNSFYFVLTTKQYLAKE